MDKKHSMAAAGAGLVVAGIGLSMVGMALIAPAVFQWTAKLIEKGAGRLAANVEGASRTVGNVAGTLHRSFNEARRAGVGEFRRGRSNERNARG